MIEQTKTFPVTRRQAFAFFTDLSRWREWTPFRVPQAVALSEPGDEVSVVYRSLKVPIGATVRLLELREDQAWEIEFRVPGTLPVLVRTKFHGAGTRASLVHSTIDFDVPGGALARSLWRLSFVPVVVRRELRMALDRAHAVLAGPLLGEKLG